MENVVFSVSFFNSIYCF